LQAGFNGFTAWAISVHQVGDDVTGDRVATRFVDKFGEDFLGGNADEVGASDASVSPTTGKPRPYVLGEMTVYPQRHDGGRTLDMPTTAWMA
jgi:hypothetical protein